MTVEERSARRRVAVNRSLVALAGLLLILVIWTIVRDVDDDRPIVTDEIAAEISEARAFARHRVILRWSALAPGTIYSIRVADADGMPVAGADEISDPVFRVPADAVIAVDGDRLLWEITARLPDGRRVRSRSFTALLY